MGFTLSFPPDWRIRNKPNEVVAISPDGDALMVLSRFENPRGSPADLARERLSALDRPTEILSMANNGLPMAVVTSTTQNGQPFKAGVIYLGDNAYLVAGTRRLAHRVRAPPAPPSPARLKVFAR